MSLIHNRQGKTGNIKELSGTEIFVSVKEEIWIEIVDAVEDVALMKKPLITAQEAMDMLNIHCKKTFQNHVSKMPKSYWKKIAGQRHFYPNKILGLRQ